MLSSNINNHIFVPLLFFFLFLQLTFVPQLFFNAPHPNLVLMLLIAASLLSNSANIFYFTFLCGFILDIFSGIYFGPTLISFLLTVFFSFYFGHRFLKELFSARLFLISFGAVFFHNIFYFVLANEGDFNKIKSGGEFLFLTVLSDAIYIALLIIPLSLALSYKINK